MTTLPSITIEDQAQQKLIQDGLVTADRFVNKSYLININDSKVVPLDERRKSLVPTRLYRIEKLVYDKKENVNDKMISVYSSLMNINGTALLIINGLEREVSFYVGIRSEANPAIAGTILQKSFSGNFPGSILKSLHNSEIAEIMEQGMSTTDQNTTKNISCVTVIPSPRDKDKTKFVQGIEKFIDTMQGETYTAVFIAQPLSKSNLELRKRGLEEMYSTLSPYLKTTLTYGDNYSKAVSMGMSESFTDGVNNSIGITNGTNESTGVSSNQGFNMGMSGVGFNSGSSRNYSSGTSWSNSVTKGTSKSTTTGTNTSESETNGTSRTLAAEHQNKSVGALLERIEDQLKRIKECEGFGFWDCACYFVADDIQTSVVAANSFKALMLGDGTSVENSYVNVWGIQNPNRTAILEYVKHGIHPCLEIKPIHGFCPQIVTPGNYIHGKELPLLMGLPQKSVAGVPVSTIAEFGRNVFVQNARPNRKTIRIGKVHHMGRTENHLVELDVNSFTSHCFITGSTGSGKSNTTYCLLERFIQNNIPFLVIEPAKGEYKDAFGDLPGINIFSTSPMIGRLLKINPFSFDLNIHILEHLDRLIEIFNACWEMYAAMPAILKDAIEQIYIDKGWDLLNSVYRGEGAPTFPTFDDLMRTLPAIIRGSGYSADTQGDYTGALVTRVKSLTNGISGQIFCDCYDIPDRTLFDENTIIDLSRVGSSETKSLIMGILILKLSEYRMANATEANSGLRHVTVMEEAHNLLKNVTGEAAGSSVVKKSVEMICNSIAEMRTYGEGFIIVDQSPTAVDIAAIKNTNTKILMRLPEKKDCESVGSAVSLNEDQIKELSKLETGIAVVMQNNWLEAVLTHIDAFSNRYERKIPVATEQSIWALRGAAVRELMNQYIVDRTINPERLMACIDSVDAVSYKKEEMKCCLRQVARRLSKGRDIHFFCETLLNISGTKSLFDIIEPTIVKIQLSEVETYDRKSVLEWKVKLSARLNDYLDLPDAYLHTIVEYLMFAQEERKKTINYCEIQRILEQEVK